LDAAVCPGTTLKASLYIRRRICTDQGGALEQESAAIIKRYAPGAAYIPSGGQLSAQLYLPVEHVKVLIQIRP
jgi:hypothetical protein